MTVRDGHDGSAVAISPADSGTVSNLESESAPAKVNLYLHITGKRDDGYHLLDSLAVFAGLADRLTFASSTELSLTVTGPFASSLSAEPDNLVLRTARMLAAENDIQPTGALTLEKNIPVASGIGGGSADAAAALRLLCRAWRLNPGPPALDRIAAALGADVPVCLRNRPLRMRGVGEKLTPAPALPRFGLVLVNPGVPLATVSVFRARSGHGSGEAVLPDRWDTAGSMAAALSGLTNDLEAAAITLVPSINDVLRAIAGTRGCLLARMSGSGASCFGLFGTDREAEAAAREIARPGWWSWGGTLAG
jgi:4-diphosphocytidyl-2-C-methyl-D-erythritol kinase